MKKSALFLLFLFILINPFRLFADDVLGELIRFSGNVEIDSFGRGVFISPVVGDRIYSSSVIRTSQDGWATILLEKQEIQIPPDSLTDMKELANRGNGGVVRLFSNILGGLVQALKAPEEDVADFGGRASDAASEDPMMDMFLDDVDADFEFEEALSALESGDYGVALDHLQLIEYPEDGSFDLEDYYAYLSFAHFSLKDFRDAYESLYGYLNSAPDESQIRFFPVHLKLMAGLSAYYSGSISASTIAIGQYLDQVGPEKANPEALIIYYLLEKKKGIDEPLYKGSRVSSIRRDINFNALSGE